MSETLEAIATTNAGSQIDGATEVKSRNLMPAKFTDEAAIKLVTQDFERGRTWLEQQAWTKQWEETSILYQSPRQGGATLAATSTRANVSRFTVAKQTNALTPGMKSGIFYETPPFLIRPKPSQSEETAFAKQTLYGALCEEMLLEDECELALDSQVTFGTCMMVAGWETETTKQKRYIAKAAAATVDMPLTGPDEIATKESDEFEEKVVEITTNRPYLEFAELGTIVVNPAWRVPNRLHDRGGWAVRQLWVTMQDLDKLRKDKRYSIPSKAALKAWLLSHKEPAGEPTEIISRQEDNYQTDYAEQPNEITTEDYEEQPIEWLERYDYTRVMTVLRFGGAHTIKIQNEDHGFRIKGKGIIPIFAANFWNCPGTPWGMGTGRLAGSDQRVEQGSLNGALDILSSTLNPMYLRDSGSNVPTQDIRKRLDAILTVTRGANQRSVGEAFAILEQPKVDPNVWVAINDSRQQSQSTTGADEAFTQGNLPQKGGSSAARTATGAGGIIAANAGKIQGPVGHFIKGILLPFLDLLDSMVKDRMPKSEIRQVLGKELGDAYKLDMGNFLNDIPNFEVLAGAHLAAKKAMAQALPLMLNLFDNPAIVKQMNDTGWTIDVKELLDMFYEVSEWKNQRQVIRKMTKQELQKQQAAQMAPIQAKTAADQGKIQAKHTADSQLLDQKQTGDLAQKLLLSSQERADGFVERRVDENALLQSPMLAGQ